jgi:transposase
MLLNHRKLLQSKAIAIENDLRATLRNFGLKVGMVGTVNLHHLLLAGLPAHFESDQLSQPVRSLDRPRVQDVFVDRRLALVPQRPDEDTECRREQQPE